LWTEVSFNIKKMSFDFLTSVILMNFIIIFSGLIVLFLETEVQVLNLKI